MNKVGKRQGGGEEGTRYIDFQLLIEVLTTIALGQKVTSQSTNVYDLYFIKVSLSLTNLM